MQRLGNAPERWPDRQYAADSLKTVITAAGDGTPEFYRLVDLDLKKREFVLTLHGGRVSVDREKEMREELIKIDEEIVALKPVVISQIDHFSLPGEPQQQVENAATLGLLNIAVEHFSTVSHQLEAPSTNIDHYKVTDLGTFAMVRADEGQTYRCTMYSVEDGAGMECEPVR